MALDEPKETDKTFDVDNITYLVDNGLLEKAGRITLDFVETFFGAGFVLTPETKLPGADASVCGSTCSC